jgi:hypothetical protein
MYLCFCSPHHSKSLPLRASTHGSHNCCQFLSKVSSYRRNWDPCPLGDSELKHWFHGLEELPVEKLEGALSCIPNATSSAKILGSSCGDIDRRDAVRFAFSSFLRSSLDSQDKGRQEMQPLFVLRAPIYIMRSTSSRCKHSTLRLLASIFRFDCVS